MHSGSSVDSSPSLYLNVHLYMDARLNMDCHFILRRAEIFFSVFETKLEYIKGYLGVKCEG